MIKTSLAEIKSNGRVLKNVGVKGDMMRRKTKLI